MAIYLVNVNLFLSPKLNAYFLPTGFYFIAWLPVITISHSIGPLLKRVGGGGSLTKIAKACSTETGGARIKLYLNSVDFTFVNNPVYCNLRPYACF